MDKPRLKTHFEYIETDDGRLLLKTSVFQGNKDGTTWVMILESLQEVLVVLG